MLFPAFQNSRVDESVSNFPTGESFPDGFFKESFFIISHSLSSSHYFLDKAGRAMIRKAMLKSKIKARRNKALTAAKPKRWLMKAVL
jgi:hypothetical protein